MNPKARDVRPLPGDTLYLIRYADGLEAAARAGIAAVVAPGGSVRDAEVIAAAKSAGISLVFASRRYFLH